LATRCGAAVRSSAPVAAALLLLALAAPATEAAQRRVLVVSEARGFKHDSIPAAVSLLERLGARSPRYSVQSLRRASSLTPTRLRGAHAVVFANTSGELLDAVQRRALVRFVRRGGGFLGTHSASDTLHRSPAYGRLLGGEFARHPAPATGTLVVEDRSHPATRRLPAAFQLMEEFYEFRSSPRRRAHVLVRLDPSTVPGATPGDRPLVWCRREERGRVFFDALGHFTDTWSDSRQRALVAGGLSWVLGLQRAPRCG
jgi:type 1 glutamine amidotransferase